MKINGMSKLLRQLSKMPESIDDMIKRTLLEFAQRIFNDAMSGIPGSIRATYKLEIRNGGFAVAIYTDNVIAAYLEFGTGNAQTVKNGLSAAEYLAGQPQEIKDEAIKFLVTGDGTMPAQPYLFPAYYKYREALIMEVNKRFENIVKQAA